MSKKYFSLLAISLIAISILAAAPAFAQNENSRGLMMGRRVGFGINGTVTAISGNTITVTTKVGPNAPASKPAKTYTVDATKATVTKNGANSTVSAIAVGDTVTVQGTATGTNIVAKIIRDGLPQNDKKPGNPPVQGNGQPVVAGKVTAVNGNTITITNNSNVTYSVDATSAKILSPGVQSATISNIATGDNLIIQGTVNGTSVTASTIIDRKEVSPSVQPTTPPPQEGPKPKQVFFGGIGSFFKKLFGF